MSEKQAVHWLKENWFQFGILLLILLALCTVAFYFLYLVPKQQEDQQLQESSAQGYRDFQKTEAESAYKQCLNLAEITYDGNWSANCLDGSGTSGCKISGANASSLHAQLANDQDLCEKHYNDTVDALK